MSLYHFYHVYLQKIIMNGIILQKSTYHLCIPCIPFLPCAVGFFYVKVIPRFPVMVFSHDNVSSSRSWRLSLRSAGGGWTTQGPRVARALRRVARLHREETTEFHRESHGSRFGLFAGTNPQIGELCEDGSLMSCCFLQNFQVSNCFAFFRFYLLSMLDRNVGKVSFEWTLTRLFSRKYHL